MFLFIVFGLLASTADYPDEDGSFRLFTYNQLKLATCNFHSSEKVGEGGFGSVFKVIYTFSILILLMSLLFNWH